MHNFRMAKRKADGTLNGFIMNFLKNGKYGRTLKLFEEKNEIVKKENSRNYEKFMKHLAKMETKKQNENDDLGFEINFGAYLHEPDPKVSEFGLIIYKFDR